MANEKMRIAVKEMKAEEASNIEIMQEVLTVLGEVQGDVSKHKVINKGLKKVSEEEMIEIITNIILEMGIPSHIKGYQYTRMSILLCMKDNEMLENITTMLYPTVASMFKTTSSRTERAIRHAIEIMWECGNQDALKTYFGHMMQRGKPTNSEFIATIVDKLKFRYKLS